MTSPNFMVIGFQIRKLHRGAESAPPPPAVLDSKKPGLFRVKTGTVRYNNKILISNGKFILGKNQKVNSLETPVMKSHKGSNVVTQTADTHKDSEKKAVTAKYLEIKPTIT